MKEEEEEVNRMCLFKKKEPTKCIREYKKKGKFK